jgi:hypothetical protein
MPDFSEILKTLGALAGVAAFAWRLVDEFGAYLRISLKIEASANGWVTVLTCVENRSNRAKDISYALLLVGPESESPLATAALLEATIKSGRQLQFTNDLAHLRVEGPVFVQGRGLIPLPYYFSENVAIGDETLTYRVPIPVDGLSPGTPYSVRFFLFAEGRLHRSTQECFITAA